MIPGLMKKISLLLLLALFSFITNAQKQSPYFVEIKGGLYMPVGGFANKKYGGNYLDNADGLAKTGFAAGLTAGYKFKKSIAAIISFGYSKNKQDAASFETYLRSTFGSQVLTEVTTNSWSVFKVMAGGHFEAPFSASSQLSFSANLQAGICKTKIPAFGYVYTTGTGPFDQAGSLKYAEINLPWTFCYNVSTGIKYKLNNRIYLLVEGNYFNSSPVYKYSYNPDFPNPGPMVTAEKKISLSSIQVVAGVGIEF